MIIKCGRKKIEVDEEDWALWNGGCYQIMTKRVPCGGWGGSMNPSIAKAKARKMIKNGEMFEIFPENPPYKNSNFKYYKFKKEV